MACITVGSRTNNRTGSAGRFGIRSGRLLQALACAGQSMPLDPLARPEPLRGLLAIKATENDRVQWVSACTVFETMAKHHSRSKRVPRMPGQPANRFTQGLNTVVVHAYLADVGEQPAGRRYPRNLSALNDAHIAARCVVERVDAALRFLKSVIPPGNDGSHSHAMTSAMLGERCEIDACECAHAARCVILPGGQRPFGGTRAVLFNEIASRPGVQRFVVFQSRFGSSLQAMNKLSGDPEPQVTSWMRRHPVFHGCVTGRRSVTVPR